MISNLAYYIGGVFLLAALFMYGTMVRGIIPDVFSDARILPIAVGLVVFGLAAYSWSRAAYSGLPSMFTRSSETPRTTAMPVQPRAPQARQPAITREPAIPRIVIRDVPAASPAKVTVLSPEPAKVIDGTPTIPSVASGDLPGPVQILPNAIDPPDARSENRVKRVVKSVGGLLHIGRKKPASPADQAP